MNRIRKAIHGIITLDKKPSEVSVADKVKTILTTLGLEHFEDVVEVYYLEAVQRKPASKRKSRR